MPRTHERSWFWRHIGFWFLPAASPSLGPEQWAKIRKRARTPNRRTRRLSTVLWLLALAFEIAASLRMARLDPWAGLLAAAWMTALMALTVRSLQTGFAQPSLDDRAALAYGAGLDSLAPNQRGRLFQQAVRDGIFARVPVDEHEAAQQLQAQGAAYRLLAPVLAVFVTAYWAVCLFGPFPATRSALAVTAVIMTWLAALVLAAPALIRLWTQPDAPGEPAAVTD